MFTAKLGVMSAAVTIVLITLLACTQTMNDSAHSGSMMNYHEIDNRLATGGHFVNDGLDAAKREGVKVVLDLRDKPPGGQKERLAEANYRASAMTYLYRVVIEKVDEKVAAQDLHAVWEPNDQWREYMDDVIESSSN